MSKKTMLLALAAISAAMLSLPALASAGEPVIDVTGTPEGSPVAISGTGTAGALSAAGEPTITCESTDISGSLAASRVSGTLSLDFTGCHIVVLGFTIKCRSAGSALDNTIKTSGTFTTTYLTHDKTKPGIAVTPANTTVICGTARIEVTGTVLGTITEPPCGGESTKATLSFNTSGGVQVHRHTTGTGSTHTLIAHTEDANGDTISPAIHGGLNAHATIEFEGGKEAKLTCV